MWTHKSKGMMGPTSLLGFRVLCLEGGDTLGCSVCSQGSAIARLSKAGPAMLRHGVRRGRQNPSLANCLTGRFRGRGGPPIPHPHSHFGAKPLHEAAGRAGGAQGCGLSGWYEVLKGRRVFGLAEAVRENGCHRDVVAAGRMGGRRAITESRKAADVRVETASMSAASSTTKLNFVAWYLRKLDDWPLLTKSLTAGVIYTCSDLCSQGLSSITAEDGEGVTWDAPRSARMLAVGLLMSGPCLHLWFGAVAKFFPNRDMISTLKKLVLGQLFYGPAFCAVFFTVNSYAQGERGSQITERLQRDLIPTLKGGLMYWPACDFITYRYIPLHLQPFVSNCFSFVWTIYLTYMAGKKAVKITPETIETR